MLSCDYYPQLIKTVNELDELQRNLQKEVPDSIINKPSSFADIMIQMIDEETDYRMREFAPPNQCGA